MIFAFALGLFSSSELSLKAINKQKKTIIGNSNDTVVKSINNLNNELNSDIGAIIGTNLKLLLKKYFDTVQMKIHALKEEDAKKNEALELIRKKANSANRSHENRREGFIEKGKKLAPYANSKGSTPKIYNDMEKKLQNCLNAMKKVSEKPLGCGEKLQEDE
jgi:hypothetical protein